MTTINCFDFLTPTHLLAPNFQQIVNQAIIKAGTEAMNSVGQAMSEVIEKMDQPIPNPFEIKFQLLNSDVWETTHRHYVDEVEAIKAALLYSHNRPNHVVGVFMEDLIVTRIRNGEPILIYEGHEEEVLIALDVKNQPVDVVMDITVSCPDCKDGFYYPFVGPKEPCRTCRGSN